MSIIILVFLRDALSYESWSSALRIKVLGHDGEDQTGTMSMDMLPSLSETDKSSDLSIYPTPPLALPPPTNRSQDDLGDTKHSRQSF
jgi:hypothetical protein